MTDIYVYNTAARGKEKFEPIDHQNVRMYVCGPTVYDHAHIGNARPYTVFDIFYRLLRHVYGTEHVTYARNITDIEDKIMDRAAQEGVSIKTITNRYTKIYQEDMRSLGNLEPDIQPKATEHLPQMIKMMQDLIAKGNAYVAEGHVMFDVTSMENYGRLSGHSRDELVAGARVEVAPYKKDPADFVLWKPSTEEQVGWGSPWGKGRPGWHLECSCMIEKHLGETIDLHAGGQDLIFPHHENEIAQSECTHGKEFVKYWMHNGYLTVDGVKMSKSLGNFYTIRELLEEHGGEPMRLSLLTAHYRQPVDFSNSNAKEQKRRLDRWYRITAGAAAAETVPTTVIEALSDDLNTPKAIAALDALASEETADQLLAGAQFMGLLMQSAEDWFKTELSAEQDAWIAENSVKYAEVRAAKDFAEADRIRDEAAGQGLVIEIAAGGEIKFKAQ
ncbi:cysteine--tRNA ligase [Kordiimonas sp. SCSIO 12603]|uniref:cysteine--tRNA ligase n=1 Tax=Kordiimonas sp. SCSIO 12603 TaxID=2829596 RepID=UPI0021043FD6|nr:cysteine--tRNA ligase [Kordiimonas sp. SCSIO 12603]UTW57563.1 cysteine--tRNA ligase [Kordiimonas sp. SCSIO 12603]